MMLVLLVRLVAKVAWRPWRTPPQAGWPLGGETVFPDRGQRIGRRMTIYLAIILAYFLFILAKNLNWFAIDKTFGAVAAAVCFLALGKAIEAFRGGLA